jgi:hypothetical protein
MCLAEVATPPAHPSPPGSGRRHPHEPGGRKSPRKGGENNPTHSLSVSHNISVPNTLPVTNSSPRPMPLLLVSVCR